MKTRLLVLAVAVAAMWTLKRHYADAGADDLRWMLAPTARLVTAATGTTFTMAPGEGYFSRERLFLIEKSCAGINFLIAAFGMLMFALRNRVRSAGSGIALVVACAAVSYAAAVIVNATRISIALWLASAHVTAGSLTAAQVHRLEGITVYFGGLVLLYELAVGVDRGTWPARAYNQTKRVVSWSRG